MPDYSLFQRTMRAASQGRSQEAIQLHEQMKESDLPSYYIYVAAMFSTCLEVRFANDASPEAIRAFGDEMRYDYRSAQPPVKQHVVEGITRGVPGEEEIMDGITPEDQYRTQLMAIRKIVGESPKLQENLGRYLAEAEAVARELEDVST